MDHRALLDDLGEALFATDERGRLVGNAPQLHVLRTTTDVLVRCDADLENDLAATFAHMAMRPRGRPSQWSREYAAYVRALAGAEALSGVRSGILFTFPESAFHGGDAVRIDEDNTDLLLGGLDEWRPDVASGLPMAAVVVDGQAVSVCASVRASKTIHCAGVETIPAHRGRSHGSKAVAAWSNMVKSTGAKPIYGTTFDNITSQCVARRLGLTPFASEFSVERDVD